ncbi:small GTPase superfamily, partial [Lophiotrema nucula]
LREYKLVLIGAARSGKTTLFTQLDWANFTDEYVPTIEDSYRRQCVVDAEAALLDVLDTSGQLEEEFSAMREQYMRIGEGFMLVYNNTSRPSFDEIPMLQQQILRVKDKNYVPMVIVGNDCSQHLNREVSCEEGQRLARQIGCIFIETDARFRMIYDNPFDVLIREIRRYNREM